MIELISVSMVLELTLKELSWKLSCSNSSTYFSINLALASYAVVYHWLLLVRFWCSVSKWVCADCNLTFCEPTAFASCLMSISCCWSSSDSAVRSPFSTSCLFWSILQVSILACRELFFALSRSISFWWLSFCWTSESSASFVKLSLSLHTRYLYILASIFLLWASSDTSTRVSRTFLVTTMFTWISTSLQI